MAGRKNQPITYRIFYDGKQVDRLPDGYKEKLSERLSERMTAYFRQHPEKLEALLDKPYVKKIPAASEGG